MKKVLFVDIDGVLNSRNSLRRNNEDRLFYGRISNLNDWPLIEEAFVQKGFPIVGCIDSDLMTKYLPIMMKR